MPSLKPWVGTSHLFVYLRADRYVTAASALQSSPNETSTHLALSALAALHIQSHSQPTANISEQLLLAEVQRKVGPSVELGEIEELRAAVGEMYVLCPFYPTFRQYRLITSSSQHTSTNSRPSECSRLPRRPRSPGKYQDDHEAVRSCEWLLYSGSGGNQDRRYWRLKGVSAVG